MGKTAKLQIWFFEVQTGKIIWKNQWNEDMQLRRTVLYGWGGTEGRRGAVRPGRWQLEGDPCTGTMETGRARHTRCRVRRIWIIIKQKRRREQNWNP